MLFAIFPDRFRGVILGCNDDRIEFLRNEPAASEAALRARFIIAPCQDALSPAKAQIIHDVAAERKSPHASPGYAAGLAGSRPDRDCRKATLCAQTKVMNESLDAAHNMSIFLLLTQQDDFRRETSR